MRPSGRAPDELRKTIIKRNYTRHAEGSVLICCGETRVLCTASVEERVPPFLRGKGEGWARHAGQVVDDRDGRWITGDGRLPEGYVADVVIRAEGDELVCDIVEEKEGVH